MKTNNEKMCEFACQALKPKYEVLKDVNWEELDHIDNTNNMDVVDETIFNY